MDYFSWGIAMNKVYKRNPNTVNELKDYISDAFTEVDGYRSLFHIVCQGVVDRYEECYKAEGGHLMHLRA